MKDPCFYKANCHPPQAVTFNPLKIRTNT